MTELKNINDAITPLNNNLLHVTLYGNKNVDIINITIIVYKWTVRYRFCTVFFYTFTFILF